MDAFTYYVICAILSMAVLTGIGLMSKVKTAVVGNQLSCIATAVAIIITLIYFEIFSETTVLYTVFVCLAIGALMGTTLARRVKMMQMPELVALFNGVGGAASALVGIGAILTMTTTFQLSTAMIALIIGTLTLTGSLVAAGKLSGRIDGKPVIWKGHEILTTTPIILLIAITVVTVIMNPPMIPIIILSILLSAFLGIAFAIRVGGADMPITISLLNSFSGVAGSIAGMAIGDILLVAIGGIVGASGLLLTQIMCRAMNSSLLKIIQGKTTSSSLKDSNSLIEESNGEDDDHSIDGEEIEEVSTVKILSQAKQVIIVPGYGMALAQAQHLVKQLADTLEKNGAEVKYAIHPVAGRMPGHMNVLLSEADVPYEQLYEMDEINEAFKECDVCIVVGANDVLNPAARDAEGTPIYGMPILNVDQAKHIVFCNRSLNPGYAGVENPLYKRTNGVSLLLGDASETLQKLLSELYGQ